MSGGKKRVSHMEQSCSKKSKIMRDVVADIMQGMNTIESKLPKISKYTRDGPGQSNLDCPSTSTQSSIAPLQQKKFLNSKRHPLMEKAQKFKNYIKHNRSIPKPRAHLGGLKVSYISTKDNLSPSSSEKAKSNSDSFKIRRGKSNFRSVGIFSNENISDDSSKCSEVSKSNFCSNDTILSDENISGDNSCNEVPILSSDSESEFEFFLQSQKYNKDKKNYSKKRKHNQHNTKSKTIKQKKYKTHTKLKSSGLKSEDNGSNESPKISSKVTATNRLKLPDTSDSDISSDDENELSNNLFKMGNISTKPTCQSNNDVEPIIQSDACNLACTVRIERDPLLDERAAQMYLPVEENNCEIVCSTKPQGSNDTSLTERNEETALDPDDDCMIVYEVPQVNVADTTKSDIQILNVVSLGEKGVIDTNEENSMNLSTSEEDMSAIDFEKIKEAIEIVKKLYISPEKTSNSNQFNSNPVFVSNIVGGNVQAVAERNINEASHVSTDVKKKDLEKILFLANNATNQLLPEEIMLNPLPYLSSIADMNSMRTIKDMNQAAFLSIPTGTIENVTKKDLKEILLLANHTSNNEISPDEKVFHSFPSSSFTDELSSLKSMPCAKSEIITGQSRVQSKLQGEDMSIQLKQDCYDPCDELDISGINSIRDLPHNQPSQNVSKLLHLYTKNLQNYHEIKNSPVSLVEGLKYLEKSSEATTKNLKTLFHHLMKSDPCSLLTLKNSQKTIVKRNLEKENASSEPVKKCINCGARATIVCDKCKIVFFCTTKCGEYYWENGHYKECEGLLQL